MSNPPTDLIPAPDAPWWDVTAPGTLALFDGRWHVIVRREPAMHDDEARVVWRPIRFGWFGFRERKNIQRIFDHLARQASIARLNEMFQPPRTGEDR